MKSLATILREDGLMIEFWWEPDANKIRATVRTEETDDGWSAESDGVLAAIELAVAVYQQDTMKAS